ncbi:CheR family methyltransferase [Pseudomonas sp. CGJS7]|uniref:CheR family methyltransferase n=1 Tax=Pseudomonas sp. CGJS7 TaxID=3109348 RepID=UPI0030097AE0
MKLSGFQQWLKDTMGLDASTIGPTIVERAVQRRMAACGRADLGQYWQLLRDSALEQQELIEAVVVPETWFFRDNQAFAALARNYDPLWAATRPAQRLRLLSLPCSTGEEPYTMVMALQDAGFPLERLDVEAIDISERALSKARQGRYGSNSFRGRELEFRERHFEATAEGWQLPKSIRSRVNFSQGNVLDLGFLPGESLYDAIFCRNLLIYFDAQTQLRTVEVLRRLLRPDGLLFVGPSEASLLLSLNFVSAQFPMAFAFRKAPARAVDAPAATASVRAIAAPTQPRAAAPLRKPIAPLRPTPARPAAAAAASVDESLLDQAQTLADNGRLAEALAACRKYLQAHGPSARALYLSGLIDSASGREREAEQHFRKVLYLEPCHEEALMHLALLLETRGDAAGGRVLRTRAERCRGAAAVGRRP